MSPAGDSRPVSDGPSSAAGAAYPPGAVLALLNTPAVTPATRAVLVARLAPTRDVVPRFLDGATYAVLAAVCARLIPQPERPQPIELAGPVDARLADGRGNGWRYAVLPPDGDAYRRALTAVDAEATRRYATPFPALDAARQDAVLVAVQHGAVVDPAWAGLSPTRWFEELLAEVTEFYYSHPFGQDEIGCAAMADGPGWTAIGLDERAPREPAAVGDDR